MMLRISIVVVLLLPLSALAASSGADTKARQTGVSTGLPLPRFVAFKSSETNIRTGPGSRYPIQWIYRREGMPVEVVDEFDVWRKIRDLEGTTGWVHKTMLDGRRNVMVRGKEPRVLRIDADVHTKPLLKAEPTVIGKLMECQKEWCRIQLAGRKGWMEKKYLWGVYPDELLD